MLGRGMELRHLRYFVAVAEEENVTRAAARLHVSQPPVSRQIRDLENELGVKLFDRTAKSVHLTEAGRVFYQEARSVLQRATEAVASVRAVANGDAGELHIGYAPSLTVQLLPVALREFQAASPGVRISLHDLSNEQMLVRLREGELDAAILAKPASRALRGLKFVELTTYQVCVAAYPAHPFARRKRVPVVEIAKERLIGYSRNEYPEYHEMLSVLCATTRRKLVVSEEHDSVTSLIAAVESGRGVAIVTESLRCMVGERLQLRPITPTPKAFCVGMIASPRCQHAALKSFLETVSSSVR